MAKAIKAKETTHYTDVQKPANDKEKAKHKVKDAFVGKAFDDLNSQEKDDLLRALAIQTGLIEE